MKIHSFRGISAATAVISTLLVPPLVAQTRQAVLGGLSPTTGKLVPVNSSNPMAASLIDVNDGVIREAEFRLQPFGTDHLLDTRTISLLVDFNQDGMIPLGRFAMGTFEISWNSSGWWAGESARLTVSHSYGDAASPPAILSMEGIGIGKARLFAYRTDAAYFDYYLWFDHYNGTVPTYPQHFSVTVSGNQEISETYDAAHASLATEVPIWNSSNLLAQKMESNIPVTFKQPVTINSSLLVQGNEVLTRAPGATGPQSLALGSGAVADDSHSIALGLNSISSGSSSFAAGNYARAREEGSTALGWGAYATGAHGAALGVWTTAAGYGSTAFGQNTTAYGWNSFVAGSGAVAGNPAHPGGYNDLDGYAAVAMGEWTRASGRASTALGHYTWAEGSSSFAAGGYGNHASGDSAVAMGRSNKGIGDISFATGDWTEAIGQSSFTMGQTTKAYGKTSFAGGISSEAGFDGNTGWDGVASFAFGDFAKATGQSSVAMGTHTTASAYAATALGGGSSAQGAGSFAAGFQAISRREGAVSLGYQPKSYSPHGVALGLGVEAWKNGQTVVGRYNEVPANYERTTGENPEPVQDLTRGDDDEVFVVGGGNESNSRRTALTVKANGDLKAAGKIEASAIIVPASGGISMGDFGANP